MLDKEKVMENTTWKEIKMAQVEKMGKSPVKDEKNLKSRKDALDSALMQIEKNFGKGAIMKLNASADVSMPSIPTGALPLDIALGIGGVPRGRIVEVYGPESSGKTTLTLNIVAQAQKLGGIAAFIDAEHALDPSYAKRLGVDIDELLVSQPDSGEQALEIAEALVRSNAIDIIVIDSVAALVPRAEIEGEMGDMQVGLQARLMSKAMRKLTGAIHKTNTVIIFINQIRMKIGVMFGSPETTTGGNALKFYSSVRMDIRRVESIMKGENAIGNRVRVKVVKNKVAPPFRKAEFDIYFDEGFSREANVLDEAVKLKLVKKSGTWYSMDDNKMGQGKDNARIYLLENPEVTDMLEVQILRFYGITIPDNLTEVAKKVKPLEGLALPDLADTESGDEPGTDKVEDQENSG